MKKNYQRNARAFSGAACPKKLKFRRLVAGSLLTAAAFMPLLSFAQSNQTSYLHQLNDIKNYSMTPANMGGLDEYLLAGTIFDNSGSGAYNQQVNYQRVDPSGHVIFSYLIDDKLGMYDERVVGNDIIDDDKSVITALRRDPQAAVETNIEVLKVDHGGKLISGRVIFSQNPDYVNMCPMGTLLVNNMLYICGHVDNGFTTSLFAGDRKAFVLQYDLGSETVVNCRTWDYTFSGFGVPSSYDYDMAMRMSLTSSGYIYVTGGCNVVHPDPGSGSDQFAGGVMSMLIDPSTLVDVANQPYCSQNVVNGSADAENGFDLFESGGYFYVFSNGYETQDQFFYGVNPGYNPIPKQWGVTCLDPNSLAPMPGQAYYRDQSISSWGVNLVEGNSGGNIILSGYQNDRTNNTYAPLTDNNDINPFLTELTPFYTGSATTMGYSYWNTILSHEGTGPFASMHDYSYRGYAYSNIAWGPRTTIRNNSVTSDIMMTAPIYNWATIPPLGVPLLAAKYVRAYNNGSVSCMSEPGATGGSSEPADISGTSNTQAVINSNVYYAAVINADFKQDVFLPDAMYDCNNNGFFRKANLATVQNANAESEVMVVLSPNPATDFVQVKLQGLADDASLTVEMTSITGQKVATLYKGIAGNMNSKLQLPALASGTYMVTIYNGSKRLSVQPLSVR